MTRRQSRGCFIRAYCSVVILGCGVNALQNSRLAYFGGILQEVDLENRKTARSTLLGATWPQGRTPQRGPTTTSRWSRSSWHARSSRRPRGPQALPGNPGAFRPQTQRKCPFLCTYYLYRYRSGGPAGYPGACRFTVQRKGHFLCCLYLSLVAYLYRVVLVVRCALSCVCIPVRLPVVVVFSDPAS